MKLTPEQKAFYEYGRTRAWLKAHRSKKYFVDVPSMGLYVWHLERDMHGLDALIRDAWQKLAACRAWVPIAQRECRSCRYYDKIRSFDICTACTPGAYLVKSCNWEPRKEEGGGIMKYLFEMPARDPARKPYAAGLSPEADSWAKANKHRIGTRLSWCRPRYSAFAARMVRHPGTSPTRPSSTRCRIRGMER